MEEIIKAQAEFKKTHRIGTKVYDLTPGIGNDQEWVKLTEVTKLVNLKIDQVNKISRELNWPKKYDMDGNTMVCFVPRENVTKYLHSRNYYTVTDADVHPNQQGSESTSTQHSGEGNPQEKNPETPGRGDLEGQGVALLNSQLFQQKASEIFRNVMKDELNHIKEELIKTVKESESKSYKVPIIISAASVSLLVAGIFLYAQLNNKFHEQSNQLMDETEKFYQANSTLQAKDVEIKFLKEKVNVPASPVSNTQTPSGKEGKKD